MAAREIFVHHTLAPDSRSVKMDLAQVATVVRATTVSPTQVRVWLSQRGRDRVRQAMVRKEITACRANDVR